MSGTPSLIDVADDPSDPAELIVGRFAVPLADHLDRLDERVCEVGRDRQQRAESRIRPEGGEVGVLLNRRHIEFAGGLRLAEPFERLLGILFERERRPHVVERLRCTGLDLEIPPIGGERLVQLLVALIGDAEQAPRTAVGRFASGDGLQNARRARGVLRLQAGVGGGHGRYVRRFARRRQRTGAERAVWIARSDGSGTVSRALSKACALTRAVRRRSGGTPP